MGYIKKLKNNELVGGTDKTTIYPVTSAEAVFEEVSDKVFKSQKYLNNHITNERIVDNTIENRKLKDDTIDMGKLNTQLKTIIQNAYDASWKVKEEPFSLETKYDANDVVYDPATNSSYVSLTADNQGNPVNSEDEGYVEGKWRIIINGISAIESTKVIDAKVTELQDQVDNKIDDAQGQLDQMIADAADSLADAESDARGAAAEASAVVANKVADAQIGYFECNTAEGTPVKATTTATIGTGADASTYKVPAKGSIVKIKMQYATTSTTDATLQFGNLTSTEHPLYYNGEPANASNSWDAGETLSVYWDGQYYQASNAQGGGGASGIKELKGITGAYIVNSGDTLGRVESTVDEAAYYQYIKYPVNEGDVVMVSGKSAIAALLWGIVGDNNAMIAKAAGRAHENGLVIVMPEGARFITLNSMIAESEQYHTIDSHPKWYYAKKGSFGAQELFAQNYLYGDLKTLEIGQTYRENEAVKTSDKQLFRVTKEVKAMNLTDEIAVGDLKTYDTDANASTYKALKAVKVYNGTETEGLYAIGRPSLVTITVDSSSLAIEEDTDISITIGGVTNTIIITAAASETKDADIAALIAAAFTNIDGWVLTDNEDGTLTLKCNTAGNNTISVSSNTGETGVLITFSAINGNSTLNQYNNGSWGDVTLAAFAGDCADIGITDNTKMWQKLSIDDLMSLATVQNTLVKTAKAESISYNNSQSGLAADNVQLAVDEVSENLFGYNGIPLISLEYHSSQRINTTTLKWESVNNTSYRVMEVSAGEVVKMTGGNVNSIHLAFLNTFEPTNGELADIVQYKGSSIFYLYVNTTELFVVPENAHYMYILYYVSGQVREPAYIGKKYSVVEDLQDKTDELMNNRDAVDISIYSKTTGAEHADGTWDSSTTAYELCRYKLDGAKHLYVKNELGLYANFAFSSSASTGDIISGTIEICAWDGVLEVPESAAYLLVNHRIAADYPIVIKLPDNYVYAISQPKKFEQFHAVKCMQLPWYRNMAVAASGRYIFATKDNGICKIDAGIETQPEIGTVLASRDSNFAPWGAAVNGDYLYLVTRNLGSGNAQKGSSPYGGFLDIIKISTWEVVYTKSYPVNMTVIAGENSYFGKASGVATYGNYLCVCKNLEGWDLYDITNRENPVLIGNVDTKEEYEEYNNLPASEKRAHGSTDSQTCRFFHDGNGNLRLAMVGYGYNLLEIYDPATTISSRSDALCTVLYSDIPHLHIKSHTKGIAVNYPYVYNTIGAWPNLVNNGNRQVGVIVTDISDLSNPSIKMVLMRKNDMTSSFVTEGSPYSLAIAENHLIMDNYGKGYAVFNISDPANPVYLGLFGTPYTSEVEYVEDGRLICTGVCSVSAESTVRPPITIWRGL